MLLPRDRRLAASYVTQMNGPISYWQSIIAERCGSSLGSAGSGLASLAWPFDFHVQGPA